VQLQEIPLMYQLLVSGNQQHSEEQVWVMQLLAAGLRGPLDAQLYRSVHLYSYCCIAASILWMLSCAGQSSCGPSVVLLHPYSACSAVQVSRIVVLLLYCCTHTLRVQLYRSVKLWSFCCAAAFMPVSHCPWTFPDRSKRRTRSEVKGWRLMQ